jgi:YVTN family beta-propeller protein
MKHMMLGMVVIGALALWGCSGGGEEETGPHFVMSLAVPGLTGTGNTASFDLGTVTTAPGRYYFTDRNNAAVDVIDTTSNTLIAQIKGTGANAFAGCRDAAGAPSSCVSPPMSSRRSGPNGIDLVTATKLYAPDVDSVKVIDTTTNTVTKSIKVGTLTGFSDTSNARADEGCVDKDHNIYMVSTNQPNPAPFASFIDTTTDTLIASVTWSGGPFNGAAGNEACVYDPGTQSFLVNNGGTTANPRGEVDVIPASLITPFKTAPQAAGASVTLNSFGAAVKRYPLPTCDPTGLALGPGTDLAVGCRPNNKGEALTVLILNRTTGAPVATLNAGGGDQIWYDPTSNRYANSASRWNSTGVNVNGGGCSAANPCTPNLIIIDAATRTVLTLLPAGNNAHSVAVDPVSGFVYMPYSSDTAPAGFQRDPLFAGSADGGVAIYTIK